MELVSVADDMFQREMSSSKNIEWEVRSVEKRLEKLDIKETHQSPIDGPYSLARGEATSASLSMYTLTASRNSAAVTKHTFGLVGIGVGGANEGAEVANAGHWSNRSL